MMSTIHELLPKIMAEVGAIAKNRENQQQRFWFRGIEDVYQHLQLLLAKYAVTMMPEVLSTTREERKTKAGGVMMTTLATIKYTFFAPDGSHCVAVMAGEGMDSGDKATPKAMTIAHKNCLLQVFMIPTEDAVDPDQGAPGEEVAPTVTDDHLGVLRDMILSTGADEKAFCEFLKVEQLEDLHAINYNMALGALNQKAKRQAHAEGVV